jgi:glycosyltransferase involved in cell wall biosynthesis
MRISVALCTCQGENHLSTQLESLASQHRLPDELVVSDDASTDGTLDVLEAFKERAAFPVRIHRNEQRLGIIGNFGRTFEAYTGDVIMPCDQDDRWLPHKIAEQAEALSDPEVTLCLGHAMVCDENLVPLDKTHGDVTRLTAKSRAAIAAGDGYRGLVGHGGYVGHAMAFPRRLLDTLLPMPTSTGWDRWLQLVGSFCGKTAERGVLTHYRRHERQASGSNHRSLSAAARQGFSKRVDHLDLDRRTWQMLLERLQSAYASEPPADAEQRLQLVRRRIALNERRLAMRRHRLARTTLAVGSLLRGDYHGVARGWLTFARDLRGGG